MVRDGEKETSLKALLKLIFTFSFHHYHPFHAPRFISFLSFMAPLLHLLSLGIAELVFGVESINKKALQR